MNNHKMVSKHKTLAFCIALGVSGSAVCATPTTWVNTKTLSVLPDQGISQVDSQALLTRSAASDAQTNFKEKLIQASAQAHDLADNLPRPIAVTLQLRNKDKLDQLVEQISTPGSAEYGKFITPQQFLNDYAPTDDQVNAVVEHLRQSGFDHIEVAKNRQIVEASGTATAVHAAFNTQLKTFPWDGGMAFANEGAVQVPQQLAGIVSGVLGLEDVAEFHTHMVRPAQTDRFSVATAASSNVLPVNPADLPVIYSAGNMPVASGATVGIITFGPIGNTISDLNAFTDAHKFPRVSTKIVGPGLLTDSRSTLASQASSSQTEWHLDSQSIVGAAGGQLKQLLFYNTGLLDVAIGGLLHSKTMGLADLINQAVTDDEAQVVSGSIGLDESIVSELMDPSMLDPMFEQAAAQGQTFVFSSGDNGVYSEYAEGGVLGANGQPQKNVDLSKYGAEYPASSPYVIAVGGTTLSTVGGTRYLGEVVWNSGMWGYNSKNEAVSHGLSSDPSISYYKLEATGGGISASEPAPPWQHVLPQASQFRRLPDVAFDASPDSGAKLIVNGISYDDATATQKKYRVVGGTSFSAPTFAGFFARVQNANGNKVPFPAPLIYKSGAANAGWLSDVTSGNNGYGNYPGYVASVGYDGSTGWGSLKVQAFNDLVAGSMKPSL